jgi:hypothetical protein
MYHDLHKFGKAYQEEMQRMAGASNMQRDRNHRQERSKENGSLRGLQARGFGLVGALSGLVLLGLFLALVAIRIM